MSEVDAEWLSILATGDQDQDQDQSVSLDPASDLESLKEARALGQHIALEFAPQFADGGDPCADKIDAYKAAQSDVDNARHEAIAGVQEVRIDQQDLRLIRIAMEACRTTSCTRSAKAAEKDAVVTLKSDTAQAVALKQAYDDAKKTRDKAVEALQDCRRHHPYEHECGERGGPGIRRGDGKCMAWSELKHG